MDQQVPRQSSATSDPFSEMSLKDLIRQLMEQLSKLFRQEARLAGAELSQSVVSAGKRLTTVIAGLVLVFAGFLMLLFGASRALALVLPLWAAYLIVGAVVVLAGLIMIGVGRSRMSARVGFVPTRTIDSLKQDKDVLLRRTQ